MEKKDNNNKTKVKKKRKKQVKNFYKIIFKPVTIYFDSDHSEFSGSE
jgi:hypothetical protein